MWNLVFEEFETDHEVVFALAEYNHTVTFNTYGDSVNSKGSFTVKRKNISVFIPCVGKTATIKCLLPNEALINPRTLRI